MNDFPECEKLTPAFRRICRGEANLPLNGNNSINHYRDHWGFLPLDGQRRVVVGPTVAGVGTHLKQLFARFGFTPVPEVEVPIELQGSAIDCAVALRGCSCHLLVALLDEQGPDWCEIHFDEILPAIKENAAKLTHDYYVTLDKLPFFMKVVGIFVRTAIKLSRRDLAKLQA